MRLQRDRQALLLNHHFFRHPLFARKGQLLRREGVDLQTQADILDHGALHHATHHIVQYRRNVLRIERVHRKVF